MKVPYFDTGVALKLVVEEPLSGRVRAFVRKRRTAIPYSRLMEVEIENALHALRYRNAITDKQLAGARSLLAEMTVEGRFLAVDLSLDRIASETLSLAALVTLKTGCRTLDLMHVATAKLLKADAFVSTDVRQLKAARLCGMSVINLEEGDG
ncbi:MAG: type II toxin-antitoxin system VapC family toxin [Bdellovibrionaceae bacterium]|nr:type II toxin-antitoxin system VapC family toxin [Pseudobdellovibrionaceae bacterium]